MYGFVKIAAAVPAIKVADTLYNTDHIISQMVLANSQGAEIICFPELSLTSATCGDLIQQQLMIQSAEAMLLKLLEASRSVNITVIVGAPLLHKNTLFNCAIVVQNGHILGIVPKTHLTNNDARLFASSWVLNDNEEFTFCGQNIPFGNNLIFQTSTYKFGIEVGHDANAPIAPAAILTMGGAEIIFNPSADYEITGNHLLLCERIKAQSSRCTCGYVYTSCGFGESSQDHVFTGKSFVAENGASLAEGQRFSLNEQITFCEIDVEHLRYQRIKKNRLAVATPANKNANYRYIQLTDSFAQPAPTPLIRSISPHPFIPDGQAIDGYCQEALCIQSVGLAKRLLHTNCSKAIIGISGGLDSTLALLVCAHAFDRLKLSRSGIIGVTMPGFGTTDRTYSNALSLMQQLGITIREVPIATAVKQHFIDISHDINQHDVTYENSQARERTQILMDIANQMNGIVVGTGDLSELALGWATYNGDHMSMYGVNASVPKTMIRHIVKWIAKNFDDPKTASILLDIVDTPISPELTPADHEGNIKQKTEDLVGPYELHDFFLYHTLQNSFSPAKIYFMATHAFSKATVYSESYDEATIKKWLTIFCRRFFNQQFKRSCLPDGPKVTPCSLSPRGDWMMPSDASSTIWLNSISSL